MSDFNRVFVAILFSGAMLALMIAGGLVWWALFQTAADWWLK